jgi:hypothetical protein
LPVSGRGGKPDPMAPASRKHFICLGIFVNFGVLPNLL